MAVAVIGAGSWGTAVAAIVAPKAPTTIWARRAELAEAINAEHENPDYLPGSTLPAELRATSDLEEAVTGAEVERNSAVPEKIPAGGLIVLRDGDPGEAEQTLGGFATAYYRHDVEIEIYIEEGDAAARDAAFDNLLQQIGAVLEADVTLGALAFGLTYDRPEPLIEAVQGAPAIKSATLTVDYETDAPLS